MRIRLAIVAGLSVGLVAAAIIVTEARARQVTRRNSSGRASPHETVTGAIDGAALSVVYGRPFMRGRKIMGALVPYDHWWCPGADEATEFTTSRPLQFGTLRVPAGTYTLFMTPRAGDWTLMINTRTGLFHTQYPAGSDLGRVTLVKRALTDPVEQLTFAFEPATAGSGGEVVMRWETTEVAAPFTVVQ